MDEDRKARTQAAAERVIGLEEEVESSGFAALDEDKVAAVRAALHAWIDTVTGAVISPGLGKVTLIHETGRESVIASPQLAYAMSKPVR